MAAREATFVAALGAVAAAPIERAARARADLHAKFARFLREAGEYPSAERWLRHGIAETESALGTDALALAPLLNELGMVGKYRGNFAEAEQVYHRALAINESHGASTASILHNLGGLAHAWGDPRAAEPFARRGIAERVAHAGTDTLALAADRAALAAILVDLEQYDEAQALLTAALTTYEQRYGATHYEVAVTLHNLGSLQYRQGDVTAAADTLSRAHTIKITTLGRTHPDLAITAVNLASCLQRLGDVAGARQHLTRAIELLDGRVAATHPTLTACRSRLDQLADR